MNKAYKTFLINIYNVFSINKFKQKSVTKKIGTIMLFIYVFSSVMFSLGFTSYGIAEALSKSKMMPLFLSLFLNFSSIIIIFTTMKTSKNTLYESKDNNFLLSLPIKTSEILIAKLLYMYLISFVLSTLILIPSLIVYAMKVNPSFTFYIFYFISLFLIPIIPTVVASFIGYILAKILPKSNKKNIFEIILSFIFLFAFLIINSSLENIMSEISAYGKTIDTIMKYISYPTYLLRESLFNLNILSLLLYTFINIVIVFISINILKLNYKKITSKTSENTISNNRNQKKLVTSSITKALIKREGNGFVASPIYIMNTTFGIVIFFGLSIASIFYDKTKIMEQLMIGSNINSSYIILVLIFFVIGMTNITASSISMEKQRFWILKSLPIKEETIINAKVLFSILLVAPVIILSLIIFKFTLGINIIDILLLIVFSFIYAVAVAKFGILINLRFPKLDALNDQVIVKQGMSSMITVLGPMALFIIIVGIFAETIIKMNFILVCLTFIVLFIILILIFNYIIKTWGIKKIRSII